MLYEYETMDIPYEVKCIQSANKTLKFNAFYIISALNRIAYVIFCVSSSLPHWAEVNQATV